MHFKNDQPSHLLTEGMHIRSWYIWEAAETLRSKDYLVTGCVPLKPSLYVLFPCCPQQDEWPSLPCAVTLLLYIAITWTGIVCMTVVSCNCCMKTLKPNRSKSLFLTIINQDIFQSHRKMSIKLNNLISS